MNKIEELIERYPTLEGQKENILESFEIIKNAYLNGNKLLIAGNGGSAADSNHIVGELMKSFVAPRVIPDTFKKSLIAVDPLRGAVLSETLQRCLPAIALVEQNALSTAYINDVDGLGVFAQQLLGFGRPGDVFLGITTSGNSKNVMRAAAVAKAMELQVDVDNIPALRLYGSMGFTRFPGRNNVTVKWDIPEKV